MVESASIIFVLLFLALLFVAIIAALFVWFSMRLRATENTSSATAGKLDELVELIKKVGAGEGGETQLGPDPSEEVPKSEDLLFGDNAAWVEQERKKCGWKDRRGKAN